MRYTNWDVLIFPEIGDTKTPLQEFGTNCTVTQDPDTAAMPMPSHRNFAAVTHPLPTVSSFIPSLLNGTPFRVSLHSWAAPVASRATKAMAQDESMVYYEAKVMLDGVCTAGILFNQDPSWPQVIDQSPQSGKGNNRQLRFPPFHSEMLTQVWADAAQNMGRIKIIIAEGIHNGQASAGFQRLRNIVTFSFQHAPLHILENCGIAWPNPGMWWQGQPLFSGVSSPVKELVDREAHAHSPRRREASMKRTHALQESSMAPPPMPSDLKAQEPFRNAGTYNKDRSWAQHGHRDDPFIGSAGFNSFYDKMTSRGTSGSGDISMPNTSRYGSSSSGDVPMRDYQRPTSPSSSYRSFPMQDAPRLQFQATSRNISEYPTPGVNEPGLGVTLHGGEDDSHFNDNFASMSPRIASGISAPSNTRVSSAANTPTGPHQDGSAAVSRAASYTGHARSVPVTTNDLPPSYIGMSSNLARPQSESRKSSSSVLVHEDAGEHADPPVAKKPRGRPKGKKEGRTSEIESEHTTDRIQRRTSSGSITNNNKENSQIGSAESSIGKRKRSIAEKYPEGVMLKSTAHLGVPESDFTSPTRKASKPSPRQDLSPSKVEFEDDLTSEGVVTRIRTVLGELENAV